jgi:hypothetical protein
VAEINRLYGKYNPEKLADVAGLVAKYGEDKLLAMVTKKYKEQEEGGGDAAAAFGSEQVEEINRLYGKYSPEKLQDVPGLLAKYGEGKLLAMVPRALGRRSIPLQAALFL